ncbi:MAG TPA: hypothetical protein PLI09_17400 [Candidatus Hydrogenedentes bacterium]|nr:hypothetical protein [Candidatus Hydrogenedentota bacterium]
MPYKGHIQNGVVVLDEAANLPEGMEVEVEPCEEISRPSLAERWKDLIGIVSGMPDDMAQNHDHYIHGTPKN